MKSAEEFYAEGGWNTDANAIASIKARDLEMWRKGMTYAAEMPNHTHSVDNAKCVLVTDIISKRDYITTV